MGGASRLADATAATWLAPARFPGCALARTPQHNHETSSTAGVLAVRKCLDGRLHSLVGLCQDGGAKYCKPLEASVQNVHRGRPRRFDSLRWRPEFSCRYG